MTLCTAEKCNVSLLLTLLEAWYRTNNQIISTGILKKIFFIKILEGDLFFFWMESWSINSKIGLDVGRVRLTKRPQKCFYSQGVDVLLPSANTDTYRYLHTFRKVEINPLLVKSTSNQVFKIILRPVQGERHLKRASLILN